MKREKAITLVGLIVTIIILLILSGVTISLTIGEDGIITQAVKAGKAQKEAEEKEKNQLEQLYSSMLIATNDSSQVTISIQDLKTLIQEEIKKTNESVVPAGTVISYMGNNAPTGYLFCDGAVYNISDYPNLAEQIKEQFGSYNYYGGDGTTTFAVPDLRGEFLRGTGTASRNTGSGGNVGQHQNGTIIPEMYTRVNYLGEGYIFFTRSKLTEDNNSYVNNRDLNYYATTLPLHQVGFKSDSSNDATSGWGVTSANEFYTTRPTNTSTLYCIKY